MTQFELHQLAVKIMSMLPEDKYDLRELIKDLQFERSCCIIANNRKEFHKVRMWEALTELAYVALTRIKDD